MQKLAIVITTIQRPTSAVRLLASIQNSIDTSFFVVGDRKGPEDFQLSGVSFLSLQNQLDSDIELARHTPVAHYSRKNIGYLAAIRSGAQCIYETDDDNAPMENWHWRNEIVECVSAVQNGWCNVYQHFTEERIWPRGLPLDEIVASVARPVAASRLPVTVQAPIQQGLANNSPDVDAVWRLVLDRPFNFNTAPSIYLPSGVWCPFNSQSTWWWPFAFPLLYLPSYCSFRMTDIWRSFVAQRCMWELGLGVVFHAPEVVQDRNPHLLMRDFNDEIPGYQQNRSIVSTLEELTLAPGPGKVAENLRTCYEALISKKVFPIAELSLVDLWIEGLRQSS